MMKPLLILFVLMMALLPGERAQAACGRGYTQNGGVCEKIVVPEHAKLNFTGDNWICGFGFQRYQGGCIPVIVPRNASLGRNSDAWRCNRGYYEFRGICLPNETTSAPRKVVPLDMKALRELAREQNNEAYAYFGGVLAFAILLAVAAIGLYLFGRRNEPAPDLYIPSPDTFRPHRVAIGGNWQYWGERIDGLTGGPIAEGVSVTQCPTCQACYAPESVAVLRRENRGRCLACSSRIHRQRVHAKFKTVLDSTAETQRPLALPAR